MGSFRLVEEAGLRLVAHKARPAASELYSPPELRGYDTIMGRVVESKSPIQISDLATHEEFHPADEADREELLSKLGLRTALYIPMLSDNELIGVLSIGRGRVEPFTENEIAAVTDFAAQAAIALEITRRERELRELQIELARANRIVSFYLC